MKVGRLFVDSQTARGGFPLFAKSWVFQAQKHVGLSGISLSIYQIFVCPEKNLVTDIQYA